MTALADLSQFHFLRPHWLWLLLPAALLCLGLARTALDSGRLQKIVDPELLPHLLLRGGEKRPWLFALIFALLASAILALAGPSWRKLPTPVYSNQDALVILMDMSSSMMARDLTPDRLTRARLKVLDILEQRRDGLTALVAYAGEAHVVTPLTDDTATIANLVPALSPAIMPIAGSNIEMAVEAGLQLLRDGASGRGQLLAVTDGIDRDALGTISRMLSGSGATLSILAVGSGEGSPIPKGPDGGFITDGGGAIVIVDFNARELQQLAQSNGGRYAQITVDDSDIAHLLPGGQAPEQAQQSDRQFDQWREEGPWLILLLLPFAALLFRRGALACALPFALLLPQESQAFEWQQLWRNKDQRGEQLLQQGDPEQAAQTFQNPQWRGTANYRAGEFDRAEQDFAQGADAQALYNLGNSLTHQGRYDDAIAAYEQALEQQPQLADAEHNREIARQLKELQQQQQQEQQSGEDQQQSEQDQQAGDGQQQPQSGGQSADQQQGEDPAQPDSGEEQQQQAQDEQPQPENGQDQQDQQESDGEQQATGAEDSPLDREAQQALEQWLREIPDDPAGLMREKFKYESLQRRRAYRAGEWRPPENGATQRW